jgi:hypothetical protein
MMFKTVVVSLGLIAFSGCVSLEPKVEATKSWERRYTTLEEASKVLDNAATTENDLQVWLLQPSTLSRLLKNAGK